MRFGPRERDSGYAELRRGRVLLRAPDSRDWRAWVALRTASRAFLEPWEPTWPLDSLSRGTYRRRLRQANFDRRQGLGYSFHIFRAEDAALIGGISLANVRRGVAQAASVGYWIGLPYARQGYMSEALSAVVDFALDTLCLHRIEAACLPHNVASRRLLEKSGFREEGCARDYLRIAGRWQDHVIYALIEGDRRHPAPEPFSEVLKAVSGDS